MTTTKTVKLKVLTRTERADLERNEKDIIAGKEATVRSAIALLDIYDRELYKARCKAWDRYCEKYLKYSKQYAYKMLRAARIIRESVNLVYGSPAPKTIDAAEALGHMPGAENRRNLWEELIENGDMPTTEEIKDAVEDALVGMDQDEYERLLQEERLAKATARAMAKPAMRVRQLTTALGFLERALRKLQRVEDTDEEQQLAAELIEMVRERL